MLRLQPNTFESFLSTHKTEVVKHLLSFVPTVIREETDDLSVFVQRILVCARENGAFSKTFVYRGMDNQSGASIRAFSMFLLEQAHKVGLWKTQTETHAVIDKAGDIHTHSTDIPQIELSWIRNKETNRFDCMIHFVEGDTQCVESWDI